MVFGLEKVDWVIQSRVDSFAGAQFLLGVLHHCGGVLQTREVGPHSCG
jgi:hypothetical protein